MFIDGVILHLEKRSFEHFEISFVEKTFYFAYLLTKRKNLSHSQAKLICWFSLCINSLTNEYSDLDLFGAETADF